jgi:hypothetical protein
MISEDDLGVIKEVLQNNKMIKFKHNLSNQSERNGKEVFIKHQEKF